MIPFGQRQPSVKGWFLPEVVTGAGRRVTLGAAGTAGTLQAAQKAVIMVFTNSTAK